MPKAGAATKPVMTLFRVTAWLAVLTIIVLSVVPGNLRPHLLGNDYFEHLAAYSLTRILLAIGFSRPVQQLASGIMLATFAGLLELVQLSVPGRTASVGEATIGAAGAGIGIISIFVITRILDRPSALSPIN